VPALIRFPPPDRWAALADGYLRRRYVLLPGLVEPGEAAEWEVRSRAWPGRMVHVGRETDSIWKEQSPPEGSDPLGGLPGADAFRRFVCSVTGWERIDDRWTRVWLNRYAPGDTVRPHRDVEGDAQLVICLQGLPDPAAGGELVLAGERVPLRTGDALLFHARKILHWVEPVGGPPAGASGWCRVTGVIRLFDSRRRESNHGSGDESHGRRTMSETSCIRVGPHRG
jgi:hypothetical protein